MKERIQHYIEEQNALRIQTMKEEIAHLSASVNGLLKKVQLLEQCNDNQMEINENFKEALEIIAEELELAEEGAES